jgi:phycocyanobilin:ferredoxin oxidoreductase
MHINIFPHEHLNFPILGFDIVAGPNKITGSFFDFSPVTNEEPEHPYMQYMRNTVKDLEWSKPRELPEWATEIFSSSMIAAGNLRTREEIEQLCSTCLHLVEYYASSMKHNLCTTNPIHIKEAHNKYCRNQKLNPHLHRSILSMGISEEDKDRYVNEVLFQEI